MNVRAWIATVAMLMCLVASISVAAQQSGNSAVHHSTVFAPDNENGGFEKAMPPSDLILNALLLNIAKSADTKSQGEELIRLDREAQRKRFRVVQIDLGDAKEEDYLALGSEPVTGADNDWFWIVQVTQGKATVLLFTGGLGVKLLPRKSNGHFDIRTYWSSAAFEQTELYRYTGSVYKLVSKHTHARQP